MSYQLYLIATPIGNLKDISFRAIEVLKSVDIIACENPNNSRVLLNNYEINKQTIQMNAIHEEQSSLYIIDLIKQGRSVAFISDAGYPCISDPGNMLVRKAIENNIQYTVIGGSSAFLNALAGSYLDVTKFKFYGFLSSKPGTKENELSALKDNEETLIFYESSHRIQDTLKVMYKVFGNRRCTIARELTKVYEEYLNTTLEMVQELTVNQQKGEFVVLVEGNKLKTDDVSLLLLEVEKLVALGLKPKAACEYISNKHDVSKNVLYNTYIKSNSK